MSYKILLADDSVTVQKIVTLTFSDEGVDVIPVNSGDDAIKRLQSLRPALVMADVSIPGKNGYEICAFIKSHPELKNTPVILLVPAFEPFDEERAARVGADHHLTKPFQSIRTLIATVKGLIEPATQTPVAESIAWPKAYAPAIINNQRNTADILQEASAQEAEAALSDNTFNTGELGATAADSSKPPDTSRLAALAATIDAAPSSTTGPLLAGSAPTSFVSLWEDDVLELDDVLPALHTMMVAPQPIAPVTLTNTSNSITQSVKLTSVESVTTIPPNIIDEIVNRVASQVTSQLSLQLTNQFNQFAARFAQDIAPRLAQEVVTQLANQPVVRSTVALPPAVPKREPGDSLLDL